MFSGKGLPNTFSSLTASLYSVVTLSASSLSSSLTNCIGESTSSSDSRISLTTASPFELFSGFLTITSLSSVACV